jgi:hypothetical protein
LAATDGEDLRTVVRRGNHLGHPLGVNKCRMALMSSIRASWLPIGSD